MAAPVDSSGTLTYWLDGIPFDGLSKVGNDAGTINFWADGQPAQALLFQGVTTTQDLFSDATILVVSAASIFSDADIAGTTIQAIFSDADITASIQRTIISDADILATFSESIFSDAKVNIIVQQTVLSNADIEALVNRAVVSNAQVVLQFNPVLLSSALIFIPLVLYGEVSFVNDKLTDRYMEVEVVQVTPDVPTDVVLLNTGTGDSLKLVWEGVAKFYNVYRVDPGPVYVKLNNYLITDHFYVIGGLMTDVSYTFLVRGADGQG